MFLKMLDTGYAPPFLLLFNITFYWRPRKAFYTVRISSANANYFLVYSFNIHLLLLTDLRIVIKCLPREEMSLLPFLVVGHYLR